LSVRLVIPACLPPISRGRHRGALGALTLTLVLGMVGTEWRAPTQGQMGFVENEREGETMEATDEEEDLLDIAFQLTAT
jgi:hypothetical protein